MGTEVLGDLFLGHPLGCEQARKVSPEDRREFPTKIRGEPVRLFERQIDTGYPPVLGYQHGFVTA
jgi:hypothetical protein